MNDRILKLTLVLLPIFFSMSFNVYSGEDTIGNTLIDKADESTSYETIFDDKMLLDGYRKKFNNLSKDITLEMIKDDSLPSYKMAAAVRTFKERFSHEIVAREKIFLEKILLRRLNRSDSAFVQVEVMDTLCRMDRYRYFEAMVPVLIQKLDHYNN